MSDRVARLTFTLQGWTGWSREQPAPDTSIVIARRGQVLGLAEFGIPAAEVDAYAQIFKCQLRLMTLLPDRAWLEYQHLVIRNPGGGINLFGPFTGTILLKPGQRVELATPTMDGGLLLDVTLTSIEEAS